MRWWDDLWLNEGFATWMASRAAEGLYPNWKAADDVNDTQSALALDTLVTTRAVRATVESPEQIEASFDAISYEKGAALLRMIERYVGTDVFREGVNRYIDEHAFRNASAADFWTTMAQVSGRPIERILPSFLDQPGAPLIELSVDCRRDGPRLVARQQPLQAREARPSESALARRWQVPVCYRSSTSDAVACHLLEDTRAEWAIAGDRCPQWVFGNVGGRGYFRTAYAPAMLHALARAPLSEAERLVLAADEWALVRAGTHPIADYLTVASELSRDRSSVVVGEVGRQLRFIHEVIASDGVRA